jgi:hypothetical protein
MRPTTKRKPPTESTSYMSTFQDILNKPASSIEPPKLFPIGTYLWLVEGQPRFDKSKQKQTDFVEFTCRCLQPGPDVDAAAAAEANVTGKTRTMTFYLTEDAVFRLSNKDGTGFLNHLDVDTDKPLGQAISEAPGRQFWGTITHRSNTNPQTGEVRIFAEISSTAKV